MKFLNKRNFSGTNIESTVVVLNTFLYENSVLKFPSFYPFVIRKFSNDATNEA